ncbi:MAG: hypothetical protein ACTH1V_06970 [Alkalibacterium gilvum]
MNFMLMVLGLSATIANIVSEEKLDEIMTLLNPTLGLALMMVILNLGAPLDNQLFLGAGAFTAIFILSRALGKYSGAYIGAKVTKLPDTVAKHLSLTLLPHSGFLLAFTGIAASQIALFDPTTATIIQGTINCSSRFYQRDNRCSYF